MQTTSQHGGLLVLRHGYLVYEKYFGRANREANPNMYSVGKMFTSVSCGIMLSEHSDRFPDGLSQKVFTKEYLPEAFPLSYPEMADIRLGNLLTMTSGIQQSHPAPPPGITDTGHLIGIVHGENVNLPYWTSPDPVLGPGRQRASWKDVGAARRRISLRTGSSHRLHRSCAAS